jgi:hypothetical protein
VRRLLAFLLYRHPELVSGSILQLALRNWRQPQPHRKINPSGIFRIDKVYFPLSAPILELLLTRNRRFHRTEEFKINEVMNCIFGSVPRCKTTPMLRNPLQQIGSNADVQRTIKLTGKDVHVRLLFLSHGQSIAAKWTLKQVQGDGCRDNVF